VSCIARSYDAARAGLLAILGGVSRIPPDPGVIAVIGPTAVGKTAFALALADGLRARGEQPVAVSSDALQVYRGVELLTGAADAAQRERLEHRMLGILDIGESCSAGRFAELAHAEIDGLLAQGRRPIVVGGTGLYLRAALADLDLRPAVAPEIRARVAGELLRDGAAAAYARLATLDPVVAARVAPTDRQRIGRALELLDSGRRPPSGDGGELWTAATRHPTRLIGLVRERDDLRALIEARVDEIVAAGAADEVRRADAGGASAAVRHAVGFDELLRGDVDAMKARTRRYARRQLTWLRKLPAIELVSLTGTTVEAAAAAVLHH
jgi:tRNA dimethylallyltransferase